MQILAPERDASTNAKLAAHGYARTASLIRKARGEAQNVLLVDNGDFLCSNGREALPDAGWQKAHPMIRVMNHLGYDAATPGNHDFDHGLDYLTAVTGQARFPFVSANVLRAGSARPIFSPHALLERTAHDRRGLPHRLRIGVIGFVPPNSLAAEAALETSDIVETARRMVPELRARGADVVIALAHSGLGEAEHRPGMENAAVPLAAIPGIDAVISGHSHQVFPGPDGPRGPAIDVERGCVHGTPVVSAGFWGSHLGLIDLGLEKTALGWQVTEARAELRAILDLKRTGAPARPVEADAGVEELVAPALRHARDWFSRPVGQSRHRIHSFFALAGPSRAVQLVQQAQRAHLQRLIAAGKVPDLPVLASASPFRTGGFGGPDNFTDIAPGPVENAHLADLYPFPNRLAVLRITGRDLRLWLERAAAIFNRAGTGDAPATILKPRDVPGYLYESVLGVDYRIDLSAPALFSPDGRRQADGPGRITGLSRDGCPVAEDDAFLLATNSWRAGGGGNYPLAPGMERVEIPAISIHDALRGLLQGKPGPDFALENHWRLTAPNGPARMRLRSAPAALDAIGDFAAGTLKPAGRDRDGYQLFELIL